MISSGDIFKTRQGYRVVVLQYTSHKRIKIKFMDEHGFEKIVDSSNLKIGSIGNPYHKSVLSVGYLGEGSFKAKVDGVQTYEHSVWKHVIEKAYCVKRKEKEKCYKDCTVSEDWLNFQNFAKWFVSQKGYKEKFHLDKDLLVKGNKHYSAETCVLLPPEVNGFMTKRDSERGLFPLGVTKRKSDKSGYAARLNIKGERLWLGTYKTEIEAFMAYKKAKEDYAKLLAHKFKNSIEEKAYDRLMDWEVLITD